MKVLMLSDAQTLGGAAIAAGRLADALRAAGHHVCRAVARIDTPGSDLWPYTDIPLRYYAVQRLAEKLHPDAGRILRQQNMIRQIHQIIAWTQPDIIHVHNIHGTDLPATLPAALSRRRPVVWTLHDMWAFTGMCAYSFACKGFASGCTGRCLYADRTPCLPAAQVPGAYRRRAAALRRAGKIAFVTPSAWLAQQAWHSMLRGQKICVIPYSLDLDTFRPIDRAVARQALGLPVDRPIILFTNLLQDPRKGGNLLQKALEETTNRNLIWLALGAKQPVEAPPGVTLLPSPAVRDDRLLQLYYNAADLHVLPTLADNLPNTLLEAAACGTPSLACDVGGVHEALGDGVAGFGSSRRGMPAPWQGDWNMRWLCLMCRRQPCAGFVGASPSGISPRLGKPRLMSIYMRNWHHGITKRPTFCRHLTPTRNGGAAVDRF